jgi:hypothetical protein
MQLCFQIELGASKLVNTYAATIRTSKGQQGLRSGRVAFPPCLRRERTDSSVLVWRDGDLAYKHSPILVFVR